MAPRLTTYYDRTAVRASVRPALRGNVDTDVCIIGGGFAGLSTALDLAERGRDVVLIEAEHVGWGASGRNGGFVAAGFPTGNLHLAKSAGPAQARALYDLSRMGQALLAERIDRYAFPGLAKQFGALRCAMSGHDALLDRIRAGMAGTFGVELDVWSAEKVRSVLATTRYGGGLFSEDTFAVHPLNLASGLAAAAESQGARLFERSACLGLQLDAPVKRVRIAEGEVRARTVVITCGGYIGSLSRPLAAATVPIATFVAVTEKLGAELEAAITTPVAISDLQFATNYYRRVGHDRLLWGGRIKAWEPGAESIERDLHRDMAAFYPGLRSARFEFVWSGLMSFLRHNMPSIGRLQDEVWYATGFGGLGLALTSMAGRLIAAAITDNDPRWREFARFGLPFAGGPLGRIPAQMLYWKAELAGRLGFATAHD